MATAPRNQRPHVLAGFDPQRPDRILRLVEADGSLSDDGGRLGVDADVGRSLYRDMALTRTLDTEALALQRQGELSLWLMCWGQEAAQSGSIRALDARDMVFPSYREHGVALARGVTPAQLFSQWRGASHSGWNSETTRLHIYSLVLGTQTLHAAGYAEGVRREASDEIVAVYFGDGSASQGDVNEALNWAAARSLPLLFICQNNQWAISTPSSAQSRTSLAQRAYGFGIPSWRVDGNDALAVHAVTEQAAALVRSGAGPALIEAETYRLAGHSSSDDPTRYRTAEELAMWQVRDPLTRLERALTDAGVEEGFFRELDEELAAFRLAVRAACREIADPVLDDLFATVYAEPHEALEAQRLQRRLQLSELDGAAAR
jgi:2-oxoisovalerate dehydrogenase E1 component alpha subunit